MYKDCVFTVDPDIVTAGADATAGTDVGMPGFCRGSAADPFPEYPFPLPEDLL